MSDEKNNEKPKDNGPPPAQNKDAVSKPSIADIQQPTDNMEVHHHPDLHHKPKKWKEYFLEFLMIFLAVSLGFIAENFREYITDREREHEFMKSLVKDIKDDIGLIDEQQTRHEQRIILLDSLIGLLNEPAIPTSTGNLYYYGRLATKNEVFTANTRTLDQMKNAGSFRVIKKDKVVSAIMSYYSVIPQIISLEETEEGENNEYRKLAVQIFNAVIFNQINSTIIVTRPIDNPPLRTTDNKLLGDLSGWVHYIKNTRIGIYQYKKVVLEKGKALIELIEKEYRLGNE